MLLLSDTQKEVSATDGGRNDPTASDFDRQEGAPTPGDLKLPTLSQTSTAAMLGLRRKQRHGRHLIAVPGEIRK